MGCIHSSLGPILKLKENKMTGKEFLLKEEHIKLLREAYIGWQDCEFGAPEIDPKRPYGNSSVYSDIAEILDIEPEGEDEFSNRQRLWMSEMHRGTQTALQIILMSGQMKPGLYKTSDKYSYDWKIVEDRYGAINRE